MKIVLLLLVWLSLTAFVTPLPSVCNSDLEVPTGWVCQHGLAVQVQWTTYFPSIQK